MFKVKINPLWIILLFVLSYFGSMQYVITYFIFLLLHEMGHMYMARALGYRFDTIDFMPFGLGLKTNSTYISVKNDILISIAGPLTNIIFILIIVMLWWFVPITYYYTLDMFYVNLSILIFNILPIFPLDGGRVIMLILKSKYRLLAVRIMRVVTIVSVILFASLFVWSIFTTFNITFFMFSVFLFLSYDSVEFDVMLYVLKGVFEKDYSKPIEIKTFILYGEVNKSVLIKYLSIDYVSKFIIVSGDKRVTLYEKDIINM